MYVNIVIKMALNTDIAIALFHFLKKVVITDTNLLNA
jgi:hypothetical protein